jgi:hypothetical protein
MHYTGPPKGCSVVSRPLQSFKNEHSNFRNFFNAKTYPCDLDGTSLKGTTTGSTHGHPAVLNKGQPNGDKAYPLAGWPERVEAHGYAKPLYFKMLMIIILIRNNKND